MDYPLAQMVYLDESYRLPPCLRGGRFFFHVFSRFYVFFVCVLRSHSLVYLRPYSSFTVRFLISGGRQSLWLDEQRWTTPVGGMHHIEYVISYVLGAYFLVGSPHLEVGPVL